jgi:hypothetical protein
LGTDDRQGLFGLDRGLRQPAPFAYLGGAEQSTPAPSAAGYGTKAGKRRRRRGEALHPAESLDAKALALPGRCAASEAVGGPATKAAAQRLEALHSTARNRPLRTAAQRGARGAPVAPQAVHSAPVSRLDDLLGDGGGVIPYDNALPVPPPHDRQGLDFEFPNDGPVPPAALGAAPVDAEPLDMHPPAATYYGDVDDGFFDDGAHPQHPAAAAGSAHVLLPPGFDPYSEPRPGAGAGPPPFGAGGPASADPFMPAAPAAAPQHSAFTPGTADPWRTAPQWW